MYSPEYAIETDRTLIDSVIRENAFATLVYEVSGKVESFHLPLFLEEDKLIGHMAKANSAWKNIDDRSILVIFHGPHCYISPTMYGNPNNVPTWNYISIQVRGLTKIIHEESFLKKALIKLGGLYDSSFNISKNIEEHPKLLAGIVGIEIPMSEVFAKFKLAQSKSKEERLNVIAALEKSLSSSDKDVAKAMKNSL